MANNIDKPLPYTVVTKTVDSLPKREQITSDKTHGFDIENKKTIIEESFAETKRENIFQEIEDKYANISEDEIKEDIETPKEEPIIGKKTEPTNTPPEPKTEDENIEVKAAVCGFDAIMATLAVMGCSLFGKNIDRKHVVLTDTEINRLSKVAAPVWEKHKGSFSIESVLIITLIGLYTGKIMKAIDLAEPIDAKKKTETKKATKDESDKILTAMETVKPQVKKTNVEAKKRGRPKKVK